MSGGPVIAEVATARRDQRQRARVTRLAISLHTLTRMFAAFQIPLSWSELLKRTAKESSEDDVLGLAAQLAYYFFLALFPAVLFILALASFFTLTNLIDDIVGALRPIAPADVLGFLEEQLRRISNTDSGGILTIGILGAIWSSSAAVVAIVGSLNRAYDIEEGRPWWKVRLTAIGLTLGLAVLVLASFTLIVAGPSMASQVASSFGLGAAFEWTWKILQWPLAFLLVATAVGLVYYFAPDAEQDWDVDHTWRRDRHTALVRRLARLQVLPRELRGLQRHLRCSGRRHRSVVVVLHFGARHPGRRRTERRDRACIAARQGSGREEARAEEEDRRRCRSRVQAAADQTRATLGHSCGLPTAAPRGFSSRTRTCRPQAGHCLGLPLLATRLWNRLRRGREQDA